jgi:hypothetical protein
VKERMNESASCEKKPKLKRRWRNQERKCLSETEEISRSM